MATNEIEVKLRETNFFTRYPCTICGGCTEKVAILAESDRISEIDDCIRVCETCLERRNFDETLEARAQSLEAWAVYLRSLKGGLKVPTFAEWCKAEREHEVRSHIEIDGIGRDEAEDKVHRDYPRAPGRPLFDGNGEELPF